MSEQNILDEIYRLSEKDGNISSLNLKCHTCKEQLQYLAGTEDGDEFYECPIAHARIRYFHKHFLCYSLTWDADVQAKERYKLVSSTISTTLQLSSNQTYWRPYYKTILTIDSHLTLPVKDDTIVVDNLIPRLQKLKAFS